MAIQGPYRRRSGVSIAAGALALTLIGAVVVPVAPPAALPVASAARPGLEGWAEPGRYTQPAFVPDTDIRYDAHVSPGEAGDEHTVSGSVRYFQGGLADDPTTTALEGVRVYAQYYERKGTQTASPVFTTTTDANGEFTIAMRPYETPYGTFQFDADATGGNSSKESYRVWVQNPIDGQLQLVKSTNNGFVVNDSAEAGLTATGTSISGYEFVFGNQIDWTEANGKSYDFNDGSDITGNVSWDLGAFTVPPTGAEVYVSYLSEAATEYVEANGAAAVGYSGAVRDAGWTNEHEQQLQLWIREQMNLAPDTAYWSDWPNNYAPYVDNANPSLSEQLAYPKWIGESTAARVDSQGNYGIGYRSGSNTEWMSVAVYYPDGESEAHTTPFYNNGFYSAQKLASAGYLTFDPQTQQLSDVNFTYYPQQIGLTIDESRTATAAGLPTIPGMTYQFVWNDANGKELGRSTAQGVDGVATASHAATAGAAEGYTVSLFGMLGTNSVELAKTGSGALADLDIAMTPGIVAQTEPVQVTQGNPATIQLESTNPDAPGTYSLADDPTWATIDPDTGVITVSPTAEGPFGEQSLTVNFTGADGVATETVTVPVVLLVEPTEFVPQEAPVVLEPTGVQTIEVGTTSDAPGTYSLVEEPTWAQIDADTGVVTVEPNQDGPFGEQALTVNFAGADGVTTASTNLALVGTVEQPQISWPSATDTEVVVGTREPVTIEAQVDNTTYGDYSLVGAPEWASVDASTGDVSAEPPTGTGHGTTVLDVLFTGKDGSTSNHQVEFYLKPEPPAVQWPAENSIIRADEAVTLPSPVDALPPGAYFTESADTPGWVSVNLDGSVHAAPTAAEADQLQPGQIVNIPITYVAEDGVTTYDYTLTLTVDEAGPMADRYRPHYRDVRFTAGSEATSGTPLADMEATAGLESSALPEGTTFSTTTEGTRIDENTGVVTFTAPAGSTETRFEVDVQVAYPDTTTDTATVTFIKDNAKMADLYTPGYPADYAVVPGGSVTIEQDGEDFEPILNSNGEPAALQPLPEFTLPARANDLGEWTATVNRATGDVTVFAPENATEPKQITVRVTYADGSWRDIRFDIAVLDGEGDAATSIPSYELIPVLPGEDFVFEQTGGVPAGTKFYLNATGGLPVSVNETTGAVSGTMPDDAAAGAGYGFEVEIAYPDGTSDQLSLELPVAKLSDLQDPQVADTQLSRGDRMTTSPLDTQLPEGTEFGLLATYIIPDGWAVYVDPATGALTVEADSTVAEGDTIEVPIVVNYPDGTQDLTHATVEATRNAGESLSVSYPTVKLRAGQRATVAPVQQYEGAVYSLGAGMPDGFAALLNPDTGAVTVEAHDTTLPGTYSIPISVRFADQSVKQTQVLVDTLTVEGYSALAEAEKMPVIDHVLRPGASAELALAAPDAREVAQFTLQGEPVWNARVNQDNNTLHVDVPADAQPGDQVTFDVAARYADGSERNVPLTVEVDYPYETVGDSPFSPLLVLASVFAGMGAIAGLIYFVMNFFGLNLPQPPGGSSIG